MIKSPALLFFATAFAGIGAAHADDATFKAYGFADIDLVHSYYNSNNFMASGGVLQPGTQIYLDHLNTYLDWKPNSRIRVLAEIGYNPSTQSSSAGTIVVSDSGKTTTVSQPSKSTKADAISLERVYADIGISDAINVRVGKFLTPAGIWNVDHGSPTITTINKPFETSMQIFPTSLTGAQLFGHLPAGDHDLSYAGWVTTGRGANIGSSSVQIPQNLDDWAVGAHIQADLAYLDGIRLGGTVHTGTARDSWQWNTTSDASDMAKSNVSQVDSAYNRENCFGLDTKLQWKSFTLQGEWNHRQILNLKANQAQTNFNAWYALLSRRFPIGDGKNFDVTPYTMFERIAFTKPQNNPSVGLTFIPSTGFDTYLAGLNFGVFGNVRLKMEYSYYVVYPAGANTYTKDDLSYSKLAAQFSVAF